MADQCKFGMGNYLFIPLVRDTCIPVMECVKLSFIQNHRPQRKRTEYSTVRSNWEGRACVIWAKTDTGENAKQERLPCFPGVLPVACEESHVW